MKSTQNDSPIFQWPLEINKKFASDFFIEPYYLYYLLNQRYPQRYILSGINKMELIQKLTEHYGVREADMLLSLEFNSTTKEEKPHTSLIPIKKDLMIYLNPGLYMEECTEILYRPENDPSEMEELKALVISCDNNRVQGGKISLLKGDSYSGFELITFTLRPINMDIEKHYNNDLGPVNKVIIDKLNRKNEKGLVLLHGKPGTGKTSYIRYLTSQVNKRLIFLAPDVMGRVSSPDFIGQLCKFENSVIVIEDAESIIVERSADSSSAVSNLLNLTDGILSDCLKIQIICSFNTDVSKIDKALLRKGRLIAQYDFKPLERSKAQALSDELGFSTKIEEDTCLTDIFNQAEENFSEQPKRNIVGFMISNQEMVKQ